MSEKTPKSRRRRWILSGALVVLILASVTALLLVQYANRSTPDKTLDAFCRALLQSDYGSAYDQFSAEIQHAISQEAFAAPLTQDQVTVCTHGIVDNLGDSVISQLKLVHMSGGSNTDIVALIKDSNSDWKIDSISRLSPVATR